MHLRIVRARKRAVPRGPARCQRYAAGNFLRCLDLEYALARRNIECEASFVNGELGVDFRIGILDEPLNPAGISLLISLRQQYDRPAQRHAAMLELHRTAGWEASRDLSSCAPRP